MQPTECDAAQMAGEKNQHHRGNIDYVPSQNKRYRLASPNVAEFIHKIVAVLADKAWIYF